jgi:prepilin-type N-terminal cleavage/methylation domain-containing protein
MRNQKKINKGFTLVEVIVVAVIVAILAAVAIPIYQSYLADSRNNSAQNAGGAVASFAGACRATNSGNAVIATAPTATAVGSMTCSSNTASTVLPANITIAVTGSGAAGGTIVATHMVAGTPYTYSY